MIPAIALILAGLIAIVIGAFLIAIPAGFAALGAALLFVGWASMPNRPPKE